MNQRQAATQIACEAIKALGSHRDACAKGTEVNALAQLLGKILGESMKVALRPDPLYGYEGEEALLMVVRHVTQSPADVASLMEGMTEEQKRVTLDLFQRILNSHPEVMG